MLDSYQKREMRMKPVLCQARRGHRPVFLGPLKPTQLIGDGAGAAAGNGFCPLGSEPVSPPFTRVARVKREVDAPDRNVVRILLPRKAALEIIRELYGQVGCRASKTRRVEFRVSAQERQGSPEEAQGPVSQQSSRVRRRRARGTGLKMRIK